MGRNYQIIIKLRRRWEIINDKKYYHQTHQLASVD